MPVKTTVVGAWPKPDYLDLPDWFSSGNGMVCYNPVMKEKALASLEKNGDCVTDVVQKAVDEVITKQLDLGLDVVTDGEIERENYFFHFVRNIQGMQLDGKTKKLIRDGASSTYAAMAVGKLEINEGWAWKEWERSVQVVEQWLTKNGQGGDDVRARAAGRVKYTIPGPMTMMDCIVDKHYGEGKERDLIDDLISCVNKEILNLAEHGCKIIQIDEPVMMRYPDKAVAYGLQDVVKCFQGLPSDVTTIVHLCCGYPDHLDQDDYIKADKNIYITLAQLLDKSGIHQASIEDAQAQNELDQLLPHFKNITIILGVVKVARSTVEPADLIEQRARDALKYIDPDRLILAPDCGLGFLPEDLIMQKLSNMVQAAKKTVF